MVTSQDFVNWVCGPELDPVFLLHLLRASRDYLKSLSSGAIHKTIYMPTVKAFSICVPAIKEQKRIAAMLNEQMAAVRRARTALVAGQIKGMPKLRMRKIAELWSTGEIAAARRVPVGEVVEIRGVLVNPTNPEFMNLPHVNGERIESRTGRLLEVQTAAEDRMTSPKFVFEPGDVLYSKLRPYLRKVSIAPFRGLCSADMYPLRVRSDKAIPEYIAATLLSEEFSEYAELESRRARMPKLNREQLFAWCFPLPHIQTQRSFVARRQSVEHLLQKMEVDTNDQLTAMDALPGAYFRRAFARQL